MTAADSPPYWVAFREDLLRSHDALESFRVQLAEDGDETVRLMAQLTPLRLQDIIAWTIALRRRRAQSAPYLKPHLA